MTPLGFVGSIVLVALIAGACGDDTAGRGTVLSGLDEPRGLVLTDDSVLCVIEAGTIDRAADSADSELTYQNNTGAVTCVETDLGHRTVATELPYANNRFSGVSVGATDLAQLAGELYVLVGEGFDETSRTVLRIEDDGGPPTVVADFLAYSRATTNPDFFDEIVVTSNPFAFLADPTEPRFLVTDGATGDIFSVAIDGTIGVYSAVEGHEVLTGLAFGPDASLFVASFSQLPHTRGSGSIVRVERDGSSLVVVGDLTTPIDVAFDSTGRLYVLEFVDAVDPVRPYDGDSGRLLRFEQSERGWAGPQVLVDGLGHPTSILTGPDDEIYISVGGAFSDAGSGSVLRFDAFTDG